MTEQLLFKGKALRSYGSVDKGTAQTDGLKIEQDRGISVKASSALLHWRETGINIIDTPGHADFLSEVERSLSVLDYAVLVVSAVEGIQAQTEVLLSAVRQMELPLFVFINKCDRLGSRSGAVFKELETALKNMNRSAVPLNRVREEGSEAVSLGNSSHEELILALGDEGLMEEYLGGGPLQGLQEAVAEAVKSCRLTPVFFGSTKLGLGVEPLLDALDGFTLEHQGEGELCGRVFKVDWDPVMGKGAHVRLFAGEVKSRQSIFLPRQGEEEKCTGLRQASGRKTVDIPVLKQNQIAVLYGLSGIRAGDVIGKGQEPRQAVSVAKPLLSVKVEPQREEDLSPLVKALSELSDEDPMLDFEWIMEKRELRIKISGKIQVEILELMLLERYSISVRFSPPSVIYKETPKAVGEGFDAYTMPKPCWAVLRFKIEPLPRGSGLQYESVVPNKDLLYRYQNHVETAVPRALAQGLHGWEVVDLKVTLIFGEHHHVHTHPLDFFLCTPLAIMNGLQNTGTNLLEPYYRVRMTAGEEFLGKAIGMILDRRGSFDTPIMESGRFTLVATVPVAESMELPADFAILTGGRGAFGSAFSHYEICPPDLIAERERIGVNPLDRAKYILEQRSALS